MTLSIVGFNVHRDTWREGDELDLDNDNGCLAKDGVVLHFTGAVGAMNYVLEEGTYSLPDLFKDIDCSQFWTGGDDTIEQSISVVFGVEFTKDYCWEYGVYEYDTEVSYVGVADTSKWTAERLAVVSVAANTPA